ncbi:MAG: deoxyribonuclease V [Planctomycetota bacterium]
MRIKQLHNWQVSARRAIELQKQLACRVCCKAIKKNIKYVGGIDCAFTKDSRKIIACIVLLEYPSLELIEQAIAVSKVNFPYIPGLLSFREAPVCLEAAAKLKKLPDVFIVDGQGISHPRRLGLASHIGLFLDKPTIGCAKSRLTGRYDEPAEDKGSRSELKDNDEIIGAVLRTRSNVKPVFVSVGHKCLLEQAVHLCLGCAVKYRLPEPVRLAHQKVSLAKTQIS